jgi:hypothetical protein
MRFLLPVLGVGLLVVTSGCEGSKWAFLRNSHDNVAASGVKPTEAELVNYLNYNSERIQSLQVQDLQLDGQQGIQAFGLSGWMVCRKARDFRLRADAVGKTMADIGSNEQEFWYWIAKAEPPYLVHCSYADLRTGSVQLPFPFQPEWVMESLGMGQYGAAQNYHLTEAGRTYRLSQDTTGSQGQPVRKIIVFNRDPGKYQVREYILQDARGKEICTADIHEVQYIQSAGVTIPKRIVLKWPGRKLQLTLRLDDVKVNQNFDNSVALFTRPSMPGIQSYDLPRNVLDGDPAQLRPAGGFGAAR